MENPRINSQQYKNESLKWNPFRKLAPNILFISDKVETKKKNAFDALTCVSCK